MRSVLFLSVMNGDPWGGSEEQWYQVALWMARNGYDVSVCCFMWKGKEQRMKVLEDAGVKLFLLPGKEMGKGLITKWKINKILLSVPWNEFGLVFINQGGWKDVVHAPFNRLRRKLKNYALSFHNYDANAKLSARKLEFLNEWVNGASMNIADADRVFDVLRTSFNVNAPNTEVIYNPITFAPPQSATSYPPVIDGKLIFTMLAALDIHRKAQDVLIDLLSQEKWRSRNWELHLYGQGADYLFLERLIEEKKMQQKIFLKGHSGNVKEVLSNTHLLFQATHLDAMPISVVEAMAMSRPCFVSNVGDMSLWVSDSVNGYVVEKADKKLMDEKLEIAWNNRGQWADMGTKSFQVFLEKYMQPYEERFAEKLLGAMKV